MRLQPTAAWTSVSGTVCEKKARSWKCIFYAFIHMNFKLDQTTAEEGRAGIRGAWGHRSSVMLAIFYFLLRKVDNR